MSSKRESIKLPDDEPTKGVAIETLVTTPKEKYRHIDRKTVEAVAEKSGFVSRSSRRRNKPKSPYTQSTTLKLREGMKEVFQEIGERLGVFDQTTFEKAILALIEKEKMDDLKKVCKGIID